MTFDEVITKALYECVYHNPKAHGELGFSKPLDDHLSDKCIYFKLGSDPSLSFENSCIPIATNLEGLKFYCDIMRLDEKQMIKMAKKLKDKLIELMAQSKLSRDTVKRNVVSIEDWYKILD